MALLIMDPNTMERSTNISINHHSIGINITSRTSGMSAIFTSAPDPNKLCTISRWPFRLAQYNGVALIWQTVKETNNAAQCHYDPCHTLCITSRGLVSIHCAATLHVICLYHACGIGLGTRTNMDSRSHLTLSLQIVTRYFCNSLI